MDSAVVSAGMPVIGKPWRRESIRASMSALLGMTLMASAAVAAGTGAASAAPSDQEWSWSDARWAEGQSLRGGPGSTGTVEIDWQVDADAAPGQEFSLELPEEIVALTSGGTGTTGVVDLLAGDTVASAAPLGVVGTWSADKSVFEVALTEGSGSADAGAGADPLGGTMEFEVTWADGAALHEGAHTLVLAGPGLSGHDQSTLVAAYAAPAQTSAQTPASTPTSTPGSATQVTPDGTQYRPAAAAAEGQGDAGTDSAAAAAGGEQSGENTPKPKPTKPKPTKPKPTPDPADPDGKGPVDKDKPEPVSRDEGGRKKVASVPSGPVGVGISMPSVGL